jgi:hypothetical protein
VTKKVSQLKRGDLTPLYGKVLSRRGHRVHFVAPVTGSYWYTFKDLKHEVVVNL